jgi:hypothetical protein
MLNPIEKHNKISQLYHWDNVAQRTEKVYEEAMGEVKIGNGQRLKKFIIFLILFLKIYLNYNLLIFFHFYSLLNAGFWFGLVWVWGASLNFLLAIFLDIINPQSRIKRQKRN